MVWGDPCRYLAETGSTNDDALVAARAGAAHGSLFLTDHQTAGRGRRGRRWVAAPGASLLFSVLLRPATNAAPSAALTLAVGLGVRAALALRSRERLSVKWPNDVLAGRRKLAGILCEGQLRGSQVEALVLGVGINLGRQALPPELQSEAVCLAELAPDGAEPDNSLTQKRESLLASVLGEVEVRVDAYLAHGAASLLEEFHQFDALAGHRVQVSGVSELSGVARGVDGEGRLLVENEGVLVPVHSGTVRTSD